MTNVSYEWTGDDGSKKCFKTYPEVIAWQADHKGTVKRVMDYTPSKEVEYCIAGAATAGRWKNYKF